MLAHIPTLVKVLIRSSTLRCMKYWVLLGLHAETGNIEKEVAFERRCSSVPQERSASR